MEKRIIRYLSGALVFLILLKSLVAQEQTIGLFFNDSLAFNGYTLFSPGNHHNSYLIDNCGYLINAWQSDYDPGLASYFLENGNLLRAGKVMNFNFSPVGIGGVIQEFTWEGDLVWEFHYYDDTYHQHHDIEYLPNGNVLLIVWESYTEEEAINAGKDPEMVVDAIWLDKLVEIEPEGLNGGNLVWEWKAWDHLIQDFDPEKENYGVVEDHPERIDFNYYDGAVVNPPEKDWMHMNSVDYNETLDQIVVSIRHLSEIWVIDHSTTTEEASGSTGGIYCMGGDLLYRWGNPQAYKRGTVDDQLLKHQHDAKWIPYDYEDGGKFMVFNNRDDLTHSSVMIFNPPQGSPGFYTDPGDLPYGPESEEWKFMEEGFYSSFMSGAQPLPNGNTLICEGSSGRFFEVTKETQETVWKYICPVDIEGVMQQGDEPSNIQVFKVERYAPDYPGFYGKVLEPGDPIENNPYPYECIIYDSLFTGLQHVIPLDEIIINNPFDDRIRISLNARDSFEISIYNMHGKEIERVWSSEADYVYINAGSWHAGLYIVQVNNTSNGQIQKLKAIKVP